MSLRERDVDAMWNKLGFTVEVSGDHVRAHLEIDGIIIVKSRRSHGKGKLDGNIPNMIRNQMKLNESQFRDAHQCPLQRTAYLEILRNKGLA